MQGYYMYGVVESQRDFPPDIPGLDGKPVYLIPWRNLAAVVSDAPLRGYAADVANATRHGAIVEETMQGGPILPMRFGTVLGERQRVVTMLEEHSGAFEEALRRLRGRVEMGSGSSGSRRGKARCQRTRKSREGGLERNISPGGSRTNGVAPSSSRLERG